MILNFIFLLYVTSDPQQSTEILLVFNCLKLLAVKVKLIQVWGKRYSPLELQFLFFSVAENCPDSFMICITT